MEGHDDALFAGRDSPKQADRTLHQMTAMIGSQAGYSRGAKASKHRQSARAAAVSRLGLCEISLRDCRDGR